MAIAGAWAWPHEALEFALHFTQVGYLVFTPPYAAHPKYGITKSERAALLAAEERQIAAADEVFVVGEPDDPRLRGTVLAALERGAVVRFRRDEFPGWHSARAVYTQPPLKAGGGRAPAPGKPRKVRDPASGEVVVIDTGVEA